MTDEYRMAWETLTGERADAYCARARGFNSAVEMREAFAPRFTDDCQDDYRRRLRLAEIECAK